MSMLQTKAADRTPTASPPPPPPPPPPEALPEMPVTNGKRRSTAASSNSPSAATAAATTTATALPQQHDLPPHKAAATSASGLFPPSGPHDDLRSSANRRRRLISYSIALATLVALSSVMERRASVNSHHAKIQLSLPSSSSLSSLSDTGVTTPSDSALAPHTSLDLPMPPAPAPASVHNLPLSSSSSSPASSSSSESPSDSSSPSSASAPASSASTIKVPGPEPASERPASDHQSDALSEQEQQQQPDSAATAAQPVSAPSALAPPADTRTASDDQDAATALAAEQQRPASSADEAAPENPQQSLSQKSTGVNVSDQELKDSVDQLIAHVDQEAEQNATASAAAAAAAASTSSATGSAASGVDHFASNASVVPSATGSTGSGSVDSGSGSTVPGSDATTPSSAGGLPGASGLPGATHTGSSASAGGSTSTGSADPARLNSQEHFDSAQKRLQAMMADEALRSFVDENDHRTLQALALQATRGDCEQKSGGSRSLFKTDAEAAANDDVERTDPLWGAWCLFMGSYKSDAMRDFVTKLRVVEEKVAVAREAASANGNATVPVDHDVFDPNAASLDDVLSSDQQSALRSQMETISTHLTDEDRRYLAALSLQATFGDCGPYGREALADHRDPADEHAELRKLREPLLDETVSRRAGALWGAWCVIQGKKRTAAANELSSRVELLVEQLSSKSRAAAAAASSSSSSSATSTSGSAAAPPPALAGKPPSDDSEHSPAVAVALSKPESQIPAAQPEAAST